MNLFTYFKPLSRNQILHITRYFQVSCNSCNVSEVLPIRDDTRNENNALQTTHEDLSIITPYFPNTFNLAAYINKSKTLQTFVHLGVNLSKIEKKPYVVEKILKLDLEEDLKGRLMFLKDFVSVEDIGSFLTKNILILCEDLQDLQVRINYLSWKKFKHNEISRIVTKNPYWLMFK